MRKEVENQRNQLEEKKKVTKKEIIKKVHHQQQKQREIHDEKIRKMQMKFQVIFGTYKKYTPCLICYSFFYFLPFFCRFCENERFFTVYGILYTS